MLRTKIAELGKLTFLDDGGLVCSVTLDEPPSLDPSTRAASLHWGGPSPGELTIGDLVAHSEHGVARYCGRHRMNNGESEFLLLEFAHGQQLWVPLDRSYLVQKLRDADRQLTPLGAKNGNWSQPYCVEVLPNAYEWPSIGTFPQLPNEPRPKLMAEWRRACAAYEKGLHANASYRQASLDYFELQTREPQPLFHWWVYRAIALRVGQSVSANARNRDEHLLLIKQYVLPASGTSRRCGARWKLWRIVTTLRDLSASLFPSMCGCSCGDGTGVNASGVVPENAWNSITSFLSSLAAAIRNGTSSFSANHATDRRAREFDISCGGPKITSRALTGQAFEGIHQLALNPVGDCQPRFSQQVTPNLP